MTTELEMIDRFEQFNSQLASLAARLDKVETVAGAHTEGINLLRGDKQRADADKAKQDKSAEQKKVDAADKAAAEARVTVAEKQRKDALDTKNQFERDKAEAHKVAVSTVPANTYTTNQAKAPAQVDAQKQNAADQKASTDAYSNQVEKQRQAADQARIDASNEANKTKGIS